MTEPLLNLRVMIRNRHGIVIDGRGHVGAIGPAQGWIGRDNNAGLRSRERARRMPDEVVDRGLSRPVPDNTTGIMTGLDAGEPSPGGDLIRKRSVVQVHAGPPRSRWAYPRWGDDGPTRGRQYS